MANATASVVTRTDVVHVNTTEEKANLLAAVSIEIQDLENERRQVVKSINEQIKRLKIKQRDLATELSTGGQLSMFTAIAKKIATAAPDDDEEDDDQGDTH